MCGRMRAGCAHAHTRVHLTLQVRTTKCSSETWKVSSDTMAAPRAASHARSHGSSGHGSLTGSGRRCLHAETWLSSSEGRLALVGPRGATGWVPPAPTCSIQCLWGSSQSRGWGSIRANLGAAQLDTGIGGAEATFTLRS